MPFEEAVLEEDADTSLRFFKIKALHIGRNNNGSSVTEDAAKKMMKNMAYKPLLANFTDVNGELDFTSHDVEITKDENGKEIWTYIEHQIGCFTADEPYIEHDDTNGRDYVQARVAVPKDYTQAVEILDRKGGTKVSAELQINAMRYDAKEGLLIFDDVELLGETCLGVDPISGDPIHEGMEGSHIELEDFSVKNNSITRFEDHSNKELINSINALTETLKSCSLNNKIKRKEEQNTLKFEELLQKYNVTEDQVTFEHGSDISEDELEKRFEEAFATPSEPVTANGMSVTYSDGSVKNFSLSLNDIQRKFTDLVNTVYKDDDDWYSCDVYADDSVVVMHSWLNDTNYRQKYEGTDGEYTLIGDRVPVHAIYVTDEEEAKLKEDKTSYASLKENYSALEAEVNNYRKAEMDAKKNALLMSDDYSGIRETAEFKALISEDNKEAFNAMNADELTVKLDAIIVQYAKAQAKQTFAATNGKQSTSAIMLPFNDNPNTPKLDAFSKWGNK